MVNILQSNLIFTRCNKGDLITPTKTLFDLNGDDITGISMYYGLDVNTGEYYDIEEIDCPLLIYDTDFIESEIFILTSTGHKLKYWLEFPTFDLISRIVE